MRASTSLRCVCAIRSGACRASSAGSVPPISRCPVSRHSAIDEPSSTRRTSSGFSTIVPTCGCSTAFTPCSPATRGDPVEVAQQRGPARSRPARAGSRSRSARSRPTAPAPSSRSPRTSRAAARTPGTGSWSGACSSVGVNPPMACRWCCASTSAIASGVGGQEPVGAQLGGGQPHLLHLGEHPVGRQLVAPPRHLAHTPGDGGSGDPVGHACSFTVTVVPVRHDSVAATARSNAASASRPVTRGGVPSSTQRANASSSAA